MTSPRTRSVRARTIRAGLGVAAALGAVVGCGGDEAGSDGGAVAAATTRTECPAPDPAAATPGGAIEGLEVERVGDYVHTLGDLDYPVCAPSGGDHSPPPHWLTCGVYDGVVPDELAVHSLEHGAVWIALGPDSTDADRAAAAALADGAKVFVSDVADLPSAVELVAWGFRLRLTSAEDPRAAAFVAELVDAGTAPEPGASCESLGSPPNPPALPTS